MGNAILVKAGSGGGSGSSGSVSGLGGAYIHNTDYICTKTGNYLVTCIGGGGGGSSQNLSDDPISLGGCGGGSGYITQSVIALNEGDKIPITIGAGGSGGQKSAGGTGGTTSFGAYLSASGGGGGPCYTSISSVNYRTVGGVGGINGCTYYHDSDDDSDRWSWGNAGKVYETLYLNGKRTFMLYVEKNSREGMNLRNSKILFENSLLNFDIFRNNYSKYSLSNDYYLNATRFYYGDGGEGIYNVRVLYNSSTAHGGYNGMHGCVYVEYIN